MIKHTPGPWKYGPRINNFIDIEHSQRDVKGAITLSLCRVQARQSWINEAKANAFLIAAAPELLEALIEARKELELYAKDDGEYYNNPKLNDAIAKATGGEK